MKEGKIIFKKESYDLVGCAYSVYNSLGYGFHEKYYQRAYAIELEKIGYYHTREVKVDVIYNKNKIGKYYLDFLVNNLIIVEIKVGSNFYFTHIRQVLSYLKVTNKKLGIIILFTPQGIRIKRIIN